MSSNESNFGDLSELAIQQASAAIRTRLGERRADRQVITDFTPLPGTPEPTAHAIPKPQPAAVPISRSTVATGRPIELSYAELLLLVLAGEGGTFRLTPGPSGRLVSANYSPQPFSPPKDVDLESRLQKEGSPSVLELRLLQAMEARIAKRRAHAGELDHYLDLVEASEPPPRRAG